MNDATLKTPLNGGGKTSLLEALLHAAGAIPRKGTIKERNTVGDTSPESRARAMSVEMNVAGCEFLGERWTFLDSPGSIELSQETQHALMVADAATVVCEPEPSKALALAPLLKFLDDRKIPHFLFINKMDDASVRVRDLLAALQHVSARPLVLRQVPLRGKDGETVTGYVDLVSERAYQYKPGQASDLIQMPEDVKERENEARRGLLESLADFDDAEEARAINALFRPNARTLIGGEATESRVKRLAGDFRVLHLATHGYFNKASPLLSGLELEPDGNEDGMLRVHEILDLSLHADLVTLSACDTALGSGYFAELPVGEEFVGLNRAFLAAGSASVMATLWPVDDRASVSVMKRFYGHVSESGNDGNAANAVAFAQRALRRSPQLGHPYYWAAYVVVGQINPEVEVARKSSGRTS